MIVPTIVPSVQLKIAAFSFPPDILVRTMTMLSVAGRQEQMTIPFATECTSTLAATKNRLRPYTIAETNRKENPCTNILNSSRCDDESPEKTSVLIPIPTKAVFFCFAKISVIEHKEERKDSKKKKDLC